MFSQLKEIHDFCRNNAISMIDFKMIDIAAAGVM